MWLSSRSREAREPESPAEVGSVTLAGGDPAVCTNRERRALPLFGPGGYAWRPGNGQQVLVIKTGPAGESPCVAGARCPGAELEPGEVAISSAGGARIVLRNDGTLALVGDVLINGRPPLTGEAPDQPEVTA